MFRHARADELISTAFPDGAELVPPAKKSLGGYGGTLRASDGTTWRVATSSRKSSRPATRQIDAVVLLLGAVDVAASRQSYVDRVLVETKSVGRAYVQLAGASTHVKLALDGRRALVKDVGVLADGREPAASSLAARLGL